MRFSVPSPGHPTRFIDPYFLTFTGAYILVLYTRRGPRFTLLFYYKIYALTTLNSRYTYERSLQVIIYIICEVKYYIGKWYTCIVYAYFGHASAFYMRCRHQREIVGMHVYYIYIYMCAYIIHYTHTHVSCRYCM